MGYIGTGLNFVFGTGNETVSNSIRKSVKNRKANNMSYLKSIRTGFKDGVRESHAELKVSGGYWKSLKKGLSAIPEGWKNGTGLKKLTGALKGVGKAMPALMALLMVATELPNIFKATKNEGIGSGLKETGKSFAGLASGAALSAIATALIPGGAVVRLIASLGGWMLGSGITHKLLGKSYSEKVAEKEAAKETAFAAQNNVQQGQKLDVMAG